MQNVTVDSVEAAVAMAEKLRMSGQVYWFRGQQKDWPIRSSLTRLSDEQCELAKQKVSRYMDWAQRTSGLENLISAGNNDPAIAVAQHYGLPTNFIDFTTEPRIAAFFASENAGPNTSEELACIVCVNVQTVAEKWKRTCPDEPPLEFLELDVPNLWRLEAQRGHFLFCPYENIEDFCFFERIYFPNTHPFPDVKAADVYPANKSQLEIILDQYFMKERLGQFTSDLTGAGGHTISMRQSNKKEGCSLDVFPNGLPEHPSWSSSALRPWLELSAERLLDARTTINFGIQLQGTEASVVARDTKEQVRQLLACNSDARRKLVGWQVEATDCSLTDEFFSWLTPKLSQLWDGLRRLPHTDDDLCTSLGMCMALAVTLGEEFRFPRKSKWLHVANVCMSEPIKIEFSATDGSYSRGYVSSANLAAAIRSDIRTYMADDRKHIADQPNRLLSASYGARRTYDFELLTPLFARELAPYQVLARNEAILYSPARIKNLGLP